MTVALITDERHLDHDPGPGHPECPERLLAVWRGVELADLGDDLLRVSSRPAPREAITAVHAPALVDLLEGLATSGGGRIDADTAMVAASWSAALLGAGSGLAAIDALDAGDAGAAFCAVRPPGHHATPTTAMGFCLLNNIAVAAAALADRGERVLIVDVDAHHGNGTQDAFWDDPRVLFVSFHQWPLYPGTGALGERGGPGAFGTTCNVPMPAGATGDHYRRAWDLAIAPVVERFDPTWVLLSVGFDAHRRDPLAQLGLTSGDLADIVAEVIAVVPAGCRVVFLEGGYDLEAVTVSTRALVRTLAGTVIHPEAPSSGGPGDAAVVAAVEAFAV